MGIDLRVNPDTHTHTSHIKPKSFTKALHTLSDLYIGFEWKLSLLF